MNEPVMPNLKTLPTHVLFSEYIRALAPEEGDTPANLQALQDEINARIPACIPASFQSRFVQGATDSQVLTGVTRMLDGRSLVMGEAVKTSFTALKETGSLDEEAVKRAHWHAGYVVALRDTLRVIRERAPAWPRTTEAGTADYPDG